VFEIPLVYDHSEKKDEKVITLQSFLRSCLEIMKDESNFNSIHGMIDHFPKKKRNMSHIEQLNMCIVRREQIMSSESTRR